MNKKIATIILVLGLTTQSYGSKIVQFLNFAQNSQATIFEKFRNLFVSFAQEKNEKNNERRFIEYNKNKWANEIETIMSNVVELPVGDQKKCAMKS